jgi:hypothetical protein
MTKAIGIVYDMRCRSTSSYKALAGSARGNSRGGEPIAGSGERWLERYQANKAKRMLSSDVCEHPARKQAVNRLTALSLLAQQRILEDRRGFIIEYLSHRVILMPLAEPAYRGPLFWNVINVLGDDLQPLSPWYPTSPSSVTEETLTPPAAREEWQKIEIQASAQARSDRCCAPGKWLATVFAGSQVIGEPTWHDRCLTFTTKVDVNAATNYNKFSLLGSYDVKVCNAVQLPPALLPWARECPVDHQLVLTQLGGEVDRIHSTTSALELSIGNSAREPEHVSSGKENTESTGHEEADGQQTPTIVGGLIESKTDGSRHRNNERTSSEQSDYCVWPTVRLKYVNYSTYFQSPDGRTLEFSDCTRATQEQWVLKHADASVTTFDSHGYDVSKTGIRLLFSRMGGFDHVLIVPGVRDKPHLKDGCTTFTAKHSRQPLGAPEGTLMKLFSQWEAAESALNFPLTLPVEQRRIMGYILNALHEKSRDGELNSNLNSGCAHARADQAVPWSADLARTLRAGVELNPAIANAPATELGKTTYFTDHHPNAAIKFKRIPGCSDLKITTVSMGSDCASVERILQVRPGGYWSDDCVMLVLTGAARKNRVASSLQILDSVDPSFPVDSYSGKRGREATAGLADFARTHEIVTAIASKPICKRQTEPLGSGWLSAQGISMLRKLAYGQCNAAQTIWSAGDIALYAREEYTAPQFESLAGPGGGYCDSFNKHFSSMTNKNSRLTRFSQGLYNHRRLTTLKHEAPTKEVVMISGEIADCLTKLTQRWKHVPEVLFSHPGSNFGIVGSCLGKDPLAQLLRRSDLLHSFDSRMLNKGQLATTTTANEESCLAEVALGTDTYLTIWRGTEPKEGGVGSPYLDVEDIFTCRWGTYETETRLTKQDQNDKTFTANLGQRIGQALNEDDGNHYVICAPRAFTTLWLPASHVDFYTALLSEIHRSVCVGLYVEPTESTGWTKALRKLPAWTHIVDLTTRQR